MLIIKYEKTNIYLHRGNMYLLKNEVFFRYVLCPPYCGSGHNDNIIMRGILSLSWLVGRILTNDRPGRETLHPGWLHYWRCWKQIIIQIDLLALLLCFSSSSVHFRYFVLISHVLGISFSTSDYLNISAEYVSVVSATTLILLEYR